MNINFDYHKKTIDYNSGHIFKGKNYRCSYITYRSLYRNSPPGTENVSLYNFQPKGETKASALILHGLGSSNVKFLLWLGPHLASVGVNTSLLILPGNYTRVENKSVSGRSYLYPDINLLYQFWENAVVDSQGTIDLLSQLGYWKDNNILIGYCLGGMISSILTALDSRITHSLFMTTGGHIPKIMYESPVTSFVRRLVESGYEADYFLHKKDLLYNTYEKDFKKVKAMSLNEIINGDIHPLFKIDPISYAHLLDMSRVTFVDAYFDSTLPVESRKILYNEMEGAKRKVLPISHVNWLPFAYIFAKYILHKVNINDRESKKALLRSQKVENPLEK